MRMRTRFTVLNAVSAEEKKPDKMTRISREISCMPSGTSKNKSLLFDTDSRSWKPPAAMMVYSNQNLIYRMGGDLSSSQREAHMIL